MTKEERDELNERMAELYGYAYDECCELDYKTRGVGVWSNPSPLTKLNAEAYSVKAKKKKKGADKGHKYTYTSVWSGRVSHAEYLNRLEDIDRKECGLFLCRLEHTEFTDDDWWRGTDYEAEAVKSYRERIKGIRMRYGLTKSEVSEFMRVA